MVAFDHIPCRSGWPSGVRGAVHFFGAAERDWPATGPGARTQSRMPEQLSRRSISAFHCPLLGRLLAKRPIHQLFGELHAFEFQELSILFETAIERHAHLPRPRKYLRVLDRDFIGKGVPAEWSVAFHHVQFIAMEISGSVEPGLIVETGYVDDERIPFPVARPNAPSRYRRGFPEPSPYRSCGWRSQTRRRSGCTSRSAQSETETACRWRGAHPANSTCFPGRRPTCFQNSLSFLPPPPAGRGSHSLDHA